ncbi:hypothetical protein Tco_1000296 [Tanacetum coccineum]
MNLSHPNQYVGEIDIEPLTLEQYLTFNNTRRRIRNHENATFEIKGQFLRELCKTTFSGSSTENAIEHIRKVLEVARLFNTNDFALLRVFPLTLAGVAKRWFDRTSPDHAKNWDKLKQNFIRRFCPPAMILEQLGEIQALKSSQELADHSYKWHNEESKNTPTSFVPIIIRRPMLATAHAWIDVFGKKISLEVGTEQITFEINERESSAVITPVSVINNLSEINEFGEPRDLEELLLSDDDLGIFTNDNDLFPNLENHDTMFLSPSGSARLNDSSSEVFCNPNSNSSINIDDFV